MIMRLLQHIPTLFAVIAYLVLPGCAPDTASSRAHQTKHFEEKSGYGVDLSHHNTVTNWELVEADFIFLKATEGSTFTDSKYISYRDKAQQHGIAVGAYHFMTTSSSAKRQFQNFYRVVGDNIDLLPVLDVEIQTRGYPKTKLQMYQHVKTFVDLCIEHYGKKPIIYSSEWFYTHYKLDELGCPFWSGDVDAKVHIPHVIHQQTIKSVPGIAGKVDYDVLKCKLSDIQL